LGGGICYIRCLIVEGRMGLCRGWGGDLAGCGGARRCVDDCAGGVVDARGAISGDSVGWGRVGDVVGRIAAGARVVAAVGTGGREEVSFAVGRRGDVIVQEVGRHFGMILR